MIYVTDWGFREVGKINEPSGMLPGLVKSGDTITLGGQNLNDPHNYMATLRAKTPDISPEESIEWNSIWNKLKGK